MDTDRRVLAGVVVSTLVFGASPAMGAGGSSAGGQGGREADTALPADVLAAIERDLGLSAEQARKTAARQEKAIKLDRSLRVSLGSAFAGSFYDARSGKLVVRVSDSHRLDEAQAAGADARPAKHSKAELEAIKEDLDHAAGKAKNSSPSARQPNGPRQASVAGMTSWYVDEQSNTVVVTVAKGRAQDAARTLAKHGDAVTIEESDLDPTSTVFMDGGDLIKSSSCSAGLNLRNPSTRQGYLLTAGHCVAAGSTLFGQGNVAFGPVLGSFYPGDDDAIARNGSGGYWSQGPWVDRSPSNGSVIETRGYTDAPVGTMVCKSGVTTLWTCGNITGKDQTVVYDGRDTLYGLTRHNACVEKGDSGGATVSVTTSFAAEGLTSGAALRPIGTRPRCLSAFGQENVSRYYPIADSLAYYGPKYGVIVG